MSDDNNAHLPLTRRQILGSLSVAGTAGALGGTATSALFTDEEAISNNQLVAGTLDMKVSWEEHYSDWSPDERQAAPGARIETNSSRLDRANETGLPTQNNPLRSVPDTNITAFMNATRQERSPTGGLSSGADPCSALSDTTQQPAVITLSDVKPGDFGEVTFDFALCDNPGFVWMIGNLVSKAENGTTEPEAASSAEGSGVELLDAARAAVWVDDGDNYQDDQSDDNGPETIVKSGSLRDVLAALSSNNGVTLSGDIPASQGGGTGVNCFSATSVHYVGFAWWVPLDIGNQVQSDSVEFNLGFYTEQCRHNTVRGAEEPDTEPTAPVQNVDTGETFDALTAAVSAATPGQELSARGGETFAEDLTLDVQDLTVRGDDDPHPVIEGSVSIQANDSSLRGFEVIDGGVTVQEGSVGVSVEDSTVRGSGTGTAGIVVEGGKTRSFSGTS